MAKKKQNHYHFYSGSGKYFSQCPSAFFLTISLCFQTKKERTTFSRTRFQREDSARIWNTLLDKRFAKVNITIVPTSGHILKVSDCGGTAQRFNCFCLIQTEVEEEGEGKETACDVLQPLLNVLPGEDGQNVGALLHCVGKREARRNVMFSPPVSESMEIKTPVV